MVVYKNLKDLKKEALNELADLYIQTSQDNIIDMGISDTGELLRSDFKEETSDSLIVGFDAPYASYVNDGQRPHSINHEVLKDWVRRKLGVKGDEIDKVAKRIAWKIRKIGIDPKPFHDSAVETIENTNLKI